MMLIDKTYRNLLLPGILMVFAISLSEFVDSLIVAQLIGTTAMAIVNLASPILLLSATLATLLGMGGSTLFSKYSGAQDGESASRTFTLSILATFISITILSLLTFLCLPTLVNVLCNGETDLIEPSMSYLKVLIISLPIITVANSAIMFLPSSGHPVTGTVLIVVANVTNLLLDVVFIQVFGMGVEGTALATLCGYALCLVIFIVLQLRGKTGLHFSSIARADIRSIPEILSMGSSSAISQLSFAIKYAFCNDIAMRVGSQSGLVAFTICIQLISITSIFLGGISSSMVRIVAFLKGQQDYVTPHRILSRTYFLQLLSTFVCVAFFECCPDFVAGIYNVQGSADIALTVNAIRIFSISLVLRCLCVTFMYYVQTIGKTLYACVISVVEGFAVLIPTALLLCHSSGIIGLWWSFTVSGLILFLMIIIVNWCHCKMHPDRYRHLTLLERDLEYARSRLVSCRLSDRKAVSEIMSLMPSDEFRAVVQDYVKEAEAAGGKIADFLIKETDKSFNVTIRSDAKSRYSQQSGITSEIQVQSDMALNMSVVNLIFEQLD